MSHSATRASVILGICQHDPSSWHEFHLIYRPLLMSYLLKQGLRESDAFDVVQDVFVKLLGKIQSYDRSKCRFRDWLFRVARNSLIDYIRRRASYEKALEGWARSKLRDFETNSVEMERSWIDLHRKNIFRHALRVVRSQVSQKTWGCFEGRLIDDRPAEEIARELGISGTGAVYVSACRVLKKVRAVCEQFDEDISYDFQSEMS
ncbi:MAG: RNA polymerase sigma factor [Isosphaeraceae bacterium]